MTRVGIPRTMTDGKMVENVHSLAFRPVIAAALLTCLLCGCELYRPELNTVAEQDDFLCGTQYAYPRDSVQYNDCLKYVASHRGKFGAR